MEGISVHFLGGFNRKQVLFLKHVLGGNSSNDHVKVKSKIGLVAGVGEPGRGTVAGGGGVGETRSIVFRHLILP